MLHWIFKDFEIQIDESFIIGVPKDFIIIKKPSFDVTTGSGYKIYTKIVFFLFKISYIYLF